MNTSYDYSDSRTVMEAVDRAMKAYFDTDDWVRERNKRLPGHGNKTYWFMSQPLGPEAENELAQ